MKEGKGYVIPEGYIGFLDNKGNDRMLFPTEGEYMEYVEDKEEDE